MLSAFVREFGGPRQVIALAERPRPDPGPGEVEVRIGRAAVNPSDLIPVTGAYRSRTVLPFVPGFEGVGIVSRTGRGVTGLREGDRVLPIGAGGLWQEYLVRPEQWCFRVPGGLSDDEAATSYVNPLTAFRLVAALGEHFGASRGHSVGVTAAASAIGRMLLRLLAQDGFTPVAIVRSEETKARLAAGFPGDITVCDGAAAASLKLDAVLDAVGGDTGNALFSRVLSPGGAFVQYGALSGHQLDPSLVASRSDVRFSFLWLRQWVHSAPREEIEAAFERSFDGIRAGHLASAVDGTFALADLAAALARQEDPARQGKVLIAP
ncbi:MAG: zinc-dependent alcohol dehydrogenase family protein [Shinella sp.]|nr:zinc-dependent alcohol dehydrogenase family protein [Shinella sp.]